MFVSFLRTAQIKNYAPVQAGKHQNSLEHGNGIPNKKFSDFLPQLSYRFLWDPLTGIFDRSVCEILLLALFIVKSQ
jgi:hypothetical protein